MEGGSISERVHQLPGGVEALDEVAAFGGEHPRGDVVVEQGEERIEEAVQVEGDDAAVVAVQFLEDVGFDEFVQGADASGEGDGGDGIPAHLFFPVRHRVRPDRFREGVVDEGFHESGQNAFVIAAASGGRVGYDAHRPAEGSAGNDAVSFCAQACDDFRGSFIEPGRNGGTGRAVNDNFLHYREFNGPRYAILPENPIPSEDNCRTGRFA